MPQAALPTGTDAGTPDELAGGVRRMAGGIEVSEEAEHDLDVFDVPYRAEEELDHDQFIRLAIS